MDAMKTGWRRHHQSRLYVRVSQAVPEELRRSVREVCKVETHRTSQRQGHATMLMNSVCAEADRANIILVLWPAPWGDNIALSKDQLIKWYEKFGFKVVQPEPVLMARQPRN